MTPSTLIQADPVQIYQGPGMPVWEPKNFKGEESSGVHTMRFAIEQSINTMTARMASEIGIDKIKPYIEHLGIMDQMPPYYAMVLGAGETTPLRLAAAYGILDNGGKKIAPTLIDRVQDRYGKTIFRADEVIPRDHAAGQDPGTAYQMVHIMEGVVQRGTAATSVGAKLKMPLAGKTGTTNGPNDTWFMGFSPDLVVGLYLGFDQPRELGPKETGGETAAPAFTEFMAEALKGKPAVSFRIPPGIRMVRVDRKTGQLADGAGGDVIWEAFKPGSEPSDQIVDGGGDATPASGDETPALPPSPDYVPPQQVAGPTIPANTGPPLPGTIVNPHPAEPPPATPATGLY